MRDVVIALQGPTFAESLMPALFGMSAAKPVIVSEAEATADWPTLDPQTWLPRGSSANERPVAVSIDSTRRGALADARDPSPVRGRVAARAARHGRSPWWETHATPRMLPIRGAGSWKMRSRWRRREHPIYRLT
jgi:hypothetical protein